jgi:hypothetical protein
MEKIPWKAYDLDDHANPHGDPEMLNVVNAPIVVLSVALIGASVWRWHEHAVAAPILLEEDSVPGFVLVVNERDCAESPRWLAPWIGALDDRDVPVRAMLVRASPAAPETVRLGDIVLPLARAPFERRVMRVLARAGIRQTPALILLDERGSAILVEALHEAPEASVDAQVSAFVALHLHRQAHAVATRSAP